MIVETRKTAQGTEYWDNVEKRSLFVPAGKDPKFKVTTKYDSLVIKSAGSKTLDVKVNTDPDLDNMNAKQLKAFAADNDIDIPGNMSKEETIRNHIAESLTADNE